METFDLLRRLILYVIDFTCLQKFSIHFPFVSGLGPSRFRTPALEGIRPNVGLGLGLGLDKELLHKIHFQIRDLQVIYV